MPGIRRTYTLGSLILRLPILATLPGILSVYVTKCVCNKKLVLNNYLKEYFY